MNTSDLIKKLQEIDKDIPFDAPIVEGDDDWMPPSLVKVYHNPPRTHLVFESVPMDDLVDKDRVKLILNNFKNGVIPLEDAVWSICDTFGLAEDE